MANFAFSLPPAEVTRLAGEYKPTSAKLQAMGVFIVQQIRDRIKSRGASGGLAWPEKVFKRLGYDDGRALLGHAATAWQIRVTPNRVEVYSDDFVVVLNHYGTAGKGGLLPTIRPRKAKALFVPITDRARTSTRHTGPEAFFIRGQYGIGGSVTRMHAPIRIASVGGKKNKMPGQLKRGRIKDGHFEVWDDREEEYKEGIPDFIFLMKADVERRPMLPDSAREKSAQRDFAAATMSPNNKRKSA